MHLLTESEKLVFNRFAVGTFGERETLPWGRGNSKGIAVKGLMDLHTKNASFRKLVA